MDKHGQLVTKFGFTVQGNGTNAKGQMVKNPRLFKYADKESGTKKTAKIS